MASFTLKGSAEFKENNYLRVTNHEEARYGLAFDALYGDKDGLIERDDIDLFLKDNRVSRLIDRSQKKPTFLWKKLYQEVESKLTISYFEKNAPWALDAFKEYLKTPASDRSETIQKTLVRYLSIQARADNHNVKVIPKWVDNGMGGHTLSLEYTSKDESKPIKAKQLMLPGSLTDPFYYDDMAFKQVALGYSFIVMDGPNGAYNIYGENSIGTKKGWGAIDGADQLQVLSDTVDNTIIAFDLDKTDTPFVTLGYSYGAETWQSWVRKSSSHETLSNYEGHIDIAGGWDMEESYKLIVLSLYLDYAESTSFSMNPVVTQKLLSFMGMDSMMDLLYGAASPIKNIQWQNILINKILASNTYNSNKMQYAELNMGEVTNRMLQHYQNHFTSLYGGCYDGMIGVLESLNIIDQSLNPSINVDLYRYFVKDETNSEKQECLANLDQGIKKMPRYNSIDVPSEEGEVGHVNYVFDHTSEIIDEIITQRLENREAETSRGTNQKIEGNLLFKELKSFDEEFQPNIKPAVDFLSALKDEEINTAHNLAIGATAINNPQDRFILKLAYLIAKYKPLEVDREASKKIIFLALDIFKKQLGNNQYEEASIENYLNALLKIHGQYISGENQAEDFMDRSHVQSFEIEKMRTSFFTLLEMNDLLETDLASKANKTFRNANFISSLYNTRDELRQHGLGFDVGLAYPWNNYAIGHYSFLSPIDQRGYNVFGGVTNLQDPIGIAGLSIFWFSGYLGFDRREVKSGGAFLRFPVTDLYFINVEDIPLIPAKDINFGIGFDCDLEKGCKFLFGVGLGF
jgi:hypothetical protein